MNETIDTATLAAHCNALRKDQGALRKRYRVDAPGEALVTDTATSAAKAGDSPMWGSVQIGASGFDVAAPVGVHRAVGGRHDLPVPGDILCAALVACVDTTIRILSNNLGIPLARARKFLFTSIECRAPELGIQGVGDPGTVALDCSQATSRALAAPRRRQCPG
jgi:hypothetical protein